MMPLPKLLTVIGIVAMALLVAGCTTPGGQTTTPTQSPTTIATPGVTGTTTVLVTPTATGSESQTPVATTAPNLTVTDTPADSGPGSSNASVTVLDKEMNESAVVVKLKSQFALELEENPSTGYTWNLTATDGLRIVSDKYVAPGTNAVGASGMHHWEIEAIAEGLQQIDGTYQRSWEQTTPDDKTYTVEVAVEP